MRRTPRPILLASLATSAVATLAWAHQPANEPAHQLTELKPTPRALTARPWFDSIIADFNATELTTRDAASDELKSDPRASLEIIAQQLSAPANLTAEQRQRLEDAAWSLFIARPRGAMGVQFSLARLPGDSTKGVRIEGTVGGFDASRVLNPGDIVLSINGREVATQPELKQEIISHDAGALVPLRIDRAGQVLDVSVRLGNYELLSTGVSLTEADLRGALRSRIERIARESGIPRAAAQQQDPIPTAPNAAQWRTAKTERDRRETVKRMMAAQVAIAEQRNPRNRNNRASLVFVNDANSAPGIQAAGADREPNAAARNDFLLTVDPSIADQITRIRAKIEQMKVQVEQIEKQLVTLRLPEEVRKQLQETRTAFLKQIEELRIQRRSLINAETR